MRQEAKIQAKKERIRQHNRKKNKAIYRCMRCKKEYPLTRLCCGTQTVWWKFTKDEYKKIKSGV